MLGKQAAATQMGRVWGCRGASAKVGPALLIGRCVSPVPICCWGAPVSPVFVGSRSQQADRRPAQEALRWRLLFSRVVGCRIEGANSRQQAMLGSTGQLEAGRCWAHFLAAQRAGISPSAQAPGSWEQGSRTSLSLARAPGTVHVACLRLLLLLLYAAPRSPLPPSPSTLFALFFCVFDGSR